MHLTISLDEPSARRLREQASARRQSAEEAAVAMLLKGLDKADDESALIEQIRAVAAA